MHIILALIFYLYKNKHTLTTRKLPPEITLQAIPNRIDKNKVFRVARGPAESLCGLCEHCGRKTKITPAIITIPHKPSVSPFSFFSAFRRRLECKRQSVCVLTSHFIRLISPMSLIKILRSIPPCLRSQENHTTCAPCFAEGQSTSDHQFSASIWHPVHHISTTLKQKIPQANPRDFFRID